MNNREMNQVQSGIKRCKLIASLVFLFNAPLALSAAPCLRYEPGVVTLTGTIKKVVFPGPPNYESVQEGDEPEPYWVLYLPKPVCVQGDPKDEFNSETEANVTALQLVMDDYDKYRTLLGKSVVATGRLMHSFTGHHHTRVLLQLDSLAGAPPSAGVVNRSHPGKPGSSP